VLVSETVVVALNYFPVLGWGRPVPGRRILNVRRFWTRSIAEQKVKLDALRRLGAEPVEGLYWAPDGTLIKLGNWAHFPIYDSLDMQKIMPQMHHRPARAYVESHVRLDRRRRRGKKGFWPVPRKR